MLTEQNDNFEKYFSKLNIDKKKPCVIYSLLREGFVSDLFVTSKRDGSIYYSNFPYEELYIKNYKNSFIFKSFDDALSFKFLFSEKVGYYQKIIPLDKAEEFQNVILIESII